MFPFKDFFFFFLIFYICYLFKVREISRKNAAAIRNAVRLEKLKQLQKLADNINVSNIGYSAVVIVMWVMTTKENIPTFYSMAFQTYMKL